MGSYRWLPMVSAVLLVTASCTHHAPAPATTAAEAATLPHLRGCGYTPPLKPWFADYRFEVDVVVKPDGTVAPGSARARTSHILKGGPEARGRAEQLATTCVFDPALRDGEPVEAPMMLDVAFNN